MAKKSSAKDAYDSLIFHLHQAKRAGDQKLARDIEKQLSALQEKVDKRLTED